MRTPNLSTVQYQPGHVPDDPAQIPRFLRDELNMIAAVIMLLAKGHIDKSFAEPLKPREGDFAYADGTTWNPGGGEGIYYFNSSGMWTQLG